MQPRFVIGYIGPVPPGGERKRWNLLLAEKKIDAFFDVYPAQSREDLELRLSEMFLLDRRGYIVDPALRPGLAPLLDVSPEEGSADIIVNDGGVLKGYVTDGSDDARLKLWFSEIPAGE